MQKKGQRRPVIVRGLQPPDTRPTPERRAKITEGLDSQDMPSETTPGAKSCFSRIRPLFTLPSAIVEAVAAWAKKFDGGEIADSPVAKLNGNGTLDKALTEHPHLRDALGLYVQDAAIMARGARIGTYDQPVAATWTPRQISEADSRMSHLQEALPREQHRFLEWLATTMLNLHDGEIPTAHEIGCQIIRLNSAEAGRHAMTGYSICVAQALHHAYRAWGRARAAERVAKEERVEARV